MNPIILEIVGLTSVFDTKSGPAAAVDGVDLVLRRGETLAVVGESGSGKSALALSVMRLLRWPGRVVAGSVRLNGRDLMALDERSMQAVRGRELAMVFQEPSTSLNPLMPVGAQVAEPLSEHGIATGRAAWDRAVALLRRVGIPAAEARALDYPHQLSGGMRQRVAIAMALACGPAVLLADEPTTALDVTVQAQVLHLLDTLKLEFGMGVVLITHDLGVVADHAQHVAVMYAGRLVETGPAEAVIGHPLHPYTRGLLACRPRPTLDGARMPLLEIGGMVPALTALPPGCAFADRCAHVQPACRIAVPRLEALGVVQVACRRAGEWA